MSYITGTIPADSNPGPLLYAAVAASFTAAGYTLVDTVVISTRTHKVWKSAAANNTQGKDWYLDFAYPTTGVASGVSFFPMEFYDPATHLAYRQADASGSTTFETTYFSKYGATGYSLESANWNYNAGSTGAATQFSISTAGFGYWISITGNRLIALSSNDPGGIVYAGFYIPTAAYAARAGANVYPLVMVKPYSAIAHVPTLLTRLPPLTAIAPLAWTVGSIYPTAHPIVTGAPRIPDGIAGISAGPLVSTYDVVFGAVQTSGAGTGAYPTGTLGTLDGLYTSNAAGTVTRGDTVTIAGNTHVLASVSGGTAALFRAA